ncbi:MAG: hypothetical protein GWP06_13880 [Actinobacteria bacterium]|nr:hypothetical protein [Actinomycetota bacterium]
MNKEQYITEEELVEKATLVLLKELGPLETSRFINLPKKLRVESVKRHQKWQKTIDKNKFLDEIFVSNKNNI